MTTKHLTDEQLAHLKHLLRVVISHAAGLGHQHAFLIEKHGDAEALYIGRDQPMVDDAGKPIESRFGALAHGLNIIHLTEPAYQWPDVREFIVAACNSIEPLLDMLALAQAETDQAHELFPPLLKGVCDALKGPAPEGEQFTWADLPQLAEDTRAALVMSENELRALKHAMKMTGVPVARAKVLIELFGDPQQLAKHGRALLTAISQYGDYKYLPDEHHKDCPVPERGGEPGNPCLCGYEAYHALNAVIRNALPPPPLPIVTRCPKCTVLHVDQDEWSTRPHRTHLCAFCKHEWRPMNVHTVGVAELPPEET